MYIVYQKVSIQPIGVPTHWTALYDLNIKKQYLTRNVKGLLKDQHKQHYLTFTNYA